MPLAIQHTLTKYEFSFSTRQKLELVGVVVKEAIFLDKLRNDFVENRLDRISKFSSQRKRGKDLKPSGKFIFSLYLREIRNQEAKLRAQSAEADLKKQRRSMHRFLVQQVHQYRDKYDKITANRKDPRSRRPPTFRQ
jgi:hypothetical protein